MKVKRLLNDVWVGCFMLVAAMLVSCGSDNEDIMVRKGQKITLSAVIGKPATRASYEDSPIEKKLLAKWEAAEKITLVSIGEAGITAVDEFTSEGDAGREVAEFSGTWNGNAGDKVICLYPAVSTSAGSARFQNVKVGSTSIDLDMPAHGPSKDVSSLKDWDVMLGGVIFTADKIEVELERQIAVLRLGVKGSVPYDSGSGYGRFITGVGLWATDGGNVPKLFGSHATLATTKSTYNGIFEQTAFYAENRPGINQQTTDGETIYYVPLLSNGILEEGDKLCVGGRIKERPGMGEKWYNYDSDKTHVIVSSKTMLFKPGNVYTIHVNL